MRSPGGAKVLGAGLALACLTALAAGPASLPQATAVRILTPADGASLNGPDVVVTLEAEGVVIGGRASDGAAAMLSLDGAPAVKSYSSRFTFRNVSAGEHRLHVELRRNDGSAFTPPVEAEARFRLSDEPAATRRKGR